MCVIVCGHVCVCVFGCYFAVGSTLSFHIAIKPRHGSTWEKFIGNAFGLNQCSRSALVRDMCAQAGSDCQSLNASRVEHV